MNLSEIRESYRSEGMSYLDASLRAAQDIILSLIARSPLAHNVTIKGGVVLQHISGDYRRATRDLDFDFIRYSLGDEAILEFIRKLGEQSSDLTITVTAPIEELKHQDYSGKRVQIRISDTNGTNIDTKLDIGVHKNLSMEQQDYCFDLGKLDDCVTLLANTREQIFAEKLKSLLRIGAISSRYKDIFDLYYLATQGDIQKQELAADISLLVFDDSTMRENNFEDIRARLDRVFRDTRFATPLAASKRQNWLDANPEEALQTILDFIGDLS